MDPRYQPNYYDTRPSAATQAYANGVPPPSSYNPQTYVPYADAPSYRERDRERYDRYSSDDDRDYDDDDRYSPPRRDRDRNRGGYGYDERNEAVIRRSRRSSPGDYDARDDREYRSRADRSEGGKGNSRRSSRKPSDKGKEGQDGEREGMEERLTKMLGSNEHHLISTAAGAIAGGFIGHEATGKKGGWLETGIGAIIGAVGAREAKKQYEKRKDKKQEASYRQ